MAAPNAVLCAMVLAGMTTACEGAKTNHVHDVELYNYMRQGWGLRNYSSKSETMHIIN